jgi:alanine racemase
VTPKPTTIVTLPIGYFDGFDRGFSNTGEVLIHGIRCRVRGRVCMNLTMVEVPKSIAARVKIGDEVVVLGVQKKERITAEEWAQKLGTISYEVVTRLGAHIPRVVVGKKSVETST